MVGKPEVRPGQKPGKEAMRDLNQPTASAEPSRTLPLPSAADSRAGRVKRSGRGRTKRGKLQMVLPAVILWKLRIAAAMEGTTSGQLILKWITEPLKAYTYPPLPDWLKKTGESGDDNSLAA